MLTLAVPAFLVAGALAMLVPLALHLIRRRPPLRAPLPTARFLVEDPRNAVRVSRPTDLPLLALRMLLLLLLGFGAGAAGVDPGAGGDEHRRPAGPRRRHARRRLARGRGRGAAFAAGRGRRERAASW